MATDIKEIASINFGIYSPEEILNMSVCKIDNPRKSGYGSVYDPRMGTTDSNQNCETCNENAIVCTGHFGHVELAEPIIHPLYYKRVINFLNCFCFKCYRLILTRDQIYLLKLNRSKGENRFVKIQEKITKVDICCHEDCKSYQPKFRFSGAESAIYMSYNQKTKNKNKTSVIVSTEEIKRVFDNISTDDVKLLGFDPKLTHPRNFIITNLPIIPPCDRPFVKADGNTCDDDITIQYIEIIKANNHLIELIEENKESQKDLFETKKQKLVSTIRFRILTTFNNSAGKAKHTTNGRPIKGIKERLTGKDGQLRNNLLGKRCNQTGRTVIGPDPTLKMGQLAVPELMANTLTVPERVTVFNRQKLQNLVNSGEVNSVIKPDGKTCINIKRFRKGTRLMPNDIIVRGDKRILVTSSKEPLLPGDQLIRNGEPVENTIHSNREYPIDIGWIIERKLTDGDIVLLNRQPTLHRASMLAMEVVVRPNKTLRFNLAINKPFNADFDGDEMNIHVAQTLESQAELKMVAAAKYNLISPQSSKSNMAIVQDSCLGSYIMTKGFQKITKDKFFNIAMALNLTSETILERVNEINSVLKQKGKRVNAYTGKGLISLFLPNDFIYEKKNNIDPEEPSVKIFKGVLYEGTLDKTVVSSSHNSLIQTMNKEYGPDMATNFIDSVIFITNNWLLNSTFTVGLGDCLVSQNSETGVSTQEKIQDVISKCFLEAETIKTNTTHAGIREMRINAALNKARDIGLKLAKDGLNPTNNYISTVKSGSKGDFFNIAQITGLIGQQNLKGQRIPLSLNHGKRSLQHYPFENLTPEMEYESRGFVSSSFIKGMNPREFYFHSTTGREGVSDTAMGTATSGYIQRRIIKLTEDMRIQYDGTVRDVTGRLYQMAYDDTGFDPIHTVNVKGTQESCDISRLIDKLNMKHEMKCESLIGSEESKGE